MVSSFAVWAFSCPYIDEHYDEVPTCQAAGLPAMLWLTAGWMNIAGDAAMFYWSDKNKGKGFILRSYDDSSLTADILFELGFLGLAAWMTAVGAVTGTWPILQAFLVGGPAPFRAFRYSKIFGNNRDGLFIPGFADLAMSAGSGLITLITMIMSVLHGTRPEASLANVLPREWSTP